MLDLGTSEPEILHKNLGGAQTLPLSDVHLLVVAPPDAAVGSGGGVDLAVALVSGLRCPQRVLGHVVRFHLGHKGRDAPEPLVQFHRPLVPTGARVRPDHSMDRDSHLAQRPGVETELLVQLDFRLLREHGGGLVVHQPQGAGGTLADHHIYLEAKEEPGGSTILVSETNLPGVLDRQGFPVQVQPVPFQVPVVHPLDQLLVLVLVPGLVGQEVLQGELLQRLAHDRPPATCHDLGVDLLHQQVVRLHDLVPQGPSVQSGTHPGVLPVLVDVGPLVLERALPEGIKLRIGHDLRVLGLVRDHGDPVAIGRRIRGSRRLWHGFLLLMICGRCRGG